MAPPKCCAVFPEKLRFLALDSIADLGSEYLLIMYIAPPFLPQFPLKPLIVPLIRSLELERYIAPPSPNAPLSKKLELTIVRDRLSDTNTAPPFWVALFLENIDFWMIQSVDYNCILPPFSPVFPSKRHPSILIAESRLP